MKMLLIGLIMIVLAGCASNDQSPTIITEREFIQLPTAYTQECYPEKPESATVQETIEIQSAAINQCNTQLRRIREFNPSP